MNAYIRFQVALWAFLYTAVLLWATTWPFHFRELKAAGRMKYIHIALFGVAVILPCVPTGVGLHAGYGLTTIPPIVCGSVNPDVGAYTVLVPLSPIGCWFCLYADGDILENTEGVIS